MYIKFNDGAQFDLCAAPRDAGVPIPDALVQAIDALQGKDRYGDSDETV